MIVDPMFHVRTGHIDIDYPFVRERIGIRLLDVRFVPVRDQVVDGFVPMSNLSTRPGVTTSTLCTKPATPRHHEDSL